MYRGAEGAENRDAKGFQVREWGRGVLLLSQLRSLGERHKLP